MMECWKLMWVKWTNGARRISFLNEIHLHPWDTSARDNLLMKSDIFSFKNGLSHTVSLCLSLTNTTWKKKMGKIQVICVDDGKIHFSATCMKLLAGDSWTNSLQKSFWRQPTSYTHNFISVNKNNSYWCRTWDWFPSL